MGRVPLRRLPRQLLPFLLAISALIVVLPYVAYRAELLPVRVIEHAHLDATAIVLPGGRVVVISAGAAAIERYDPARNRWLRAGNIPKGGLVSTATLLADGRILTFGQRFDGGRGGQIYDPATGDWLMTDKLVGDGYGQTATRLRDGTVLVAGDGRMSGNADIATRYDPATNSWLPAARMLAGHSGHTATLLADGRVLILGGTIGAGAIGAELYDPATDSWRATSTPPRAGASTTTLLADGRVLVVVGDDAGRIELYEPTSDSWQIAAPLVPARSRATATLLTDGSVLVVGGTFYDGTARPIRLDDAVRYDPGADRWSAARRMTVGRAGHSAALLPDGDVLVIDGNDPAYAASAERFSVSTGRWSDVSGITIGPTVPQMALLGTLLGLYALSALVAIQRSSTRFGRWWFERIARGRYPLPLNTRSKRGLLALHSAMAMLAISIATDALHETSLWPGKLEPYPPLLIGGYVGAILCLLVAFMYRDVSQPPAAKQPAVS